MKKNTSDATLDRLASNPYYTPSDGQQSQLDDRRQNTYKSNPSIEKNNSGFTVHDTGLKVDVEVDKGKIVKDSNATK